MLDKYSKIEWAYEVYVIKIAKICVRRRFLKYSNIVLKTNNFFFQGASCRFYCFNT